MMDYFAGLDVSLETVSICIVNAAGDVVLERKVEAEPAAIAAVLQHVGRPFKRIGLEAGPTSSWLYSELRGIGANVEFGAYDTTQRSIKKSPAGAISASNGSPTTGPCGTIMTCLAPSSR